MSARVYQPYFVAFAVAQGVTPDELAARRGWTMDFQVWIAGRWAAFREVRPDLFTREDYGSGYRKLPGAHEAFGAWLCGGVA